MEEEIKAGKNYGQNIGGSLSELEDVMGELEIKVFGNIPTNNTIGQPVPSEIVTNRAEEIQNRLKKQIHIARNIKEALKLF